MGEDVIVVGGSEKEDVICDTIAVLLTESFWMSGFQQQSFPSTVVGVHLHSDGGYTIGQRLGEGIG
jgi:hypothetical protein